MIVNMGYRGKVGASVPKFTYTGAYNVRNDGVVELLTSGTLVFLNPTVIDRFMVGGGGAGGLSTGTANSGGGGGGGGYTKTDKNVAVAANTNINIVIGAGGTPTYGSGAAAVHGKATSWDTISVNGGEGVSWSSANAGRIGGNGGSGGGGGVTSNSDYGAGGSNGNNGESGFPTSLLGGNGQGTTTREFGEANGKLYAGGGGGGRFMVSSTPIISPGGSGGGGAGGWTSSYGGQWQAPSAGGANTGGGGGGGFYLPDDARKGGSGGSGIVCFRDAAPLPGLAGTWVLNERLYGPENNFTESVAYAAGASIGAITNNMDKISTMASDIGAGNLTLYMRPTGSTSTRGTAVYDFVTNTWTNTAKYKYLTFPAGATASDEFRAWLASNATKQ